MGGLSYLLHGGEPTSFLVYGTGRVLTPKQVQQWNQELQELIQADESDGDLVSALKECFDPAKMQPGDTEDLMIEWKQEDWVQHPAMQEFRRFFSYGEPFSEEQLFTSLIFRIILSKTRKMTFFYK